MAAPIAIGPLSPTDLAGVKKLVAAATAADGVAPLSASALASLDRDEPWLTHAVAHAKGGAVTGYLQVNRSGPRADAELVVDPQHRRRAIGRMLVGVAARDVTLPQVGGPSGAGHLPLDLVAHGDLGEARAFAAALGFVPRGDTSADPNARTGPDSSPPDARYSRVG